MKDVDDRNLPTAGFATAPTDVLWYGRSNDTSILDQYGKAAFAPERLGIVEKEMLAFAEIVGYRDPMASFETSNPDREKIRLERILAKLATIPAYRREAECADERMSTVQALLRNLVKDLTLLIVLLTIGQL